MSNDSELRHLAREYAIAARPSVVGDRVRYFDAMREDRADIRPRSGTYFIAEPDTGLVKIGRAYDVAQRLGSLQVGNPRPLMILLVVEDRESDVHQKFNHLRVRGEWFRRDAEMDAYIAERHIAMNASGVAN